MPHDTVGLVGVQVPWNRIANAGMYVESFESWGSKIVGGRLVKIVGGMIPAAIATVELLLNDPSAQAANGSDSLWLQLPITHVDDFRVFSWVFEDRGVADDEEVIAMYMPASGLFAGRKARFSLAISPKGTLRSTFAAVQRGEEEPDSEPIWMHAARAPFVLAGGK